MSGILNVDKPRGPTSFDIVRAVRRGTGEKRVGHAGALDPAASGVLLVLLEQATRITEYLMDLPKVYRAVVRLGVTTTTYDTEGDVTAQRDVEVSEMEVKHTLTTFAGEILQTPPAFSALKIGGEPAYRAARRGEAVEMTPRPVRIYRTDLLAFNPPDAEIEVECGRGTYIRSLAHDLGQALGCGAHLADLERVEIGPFSVAQAVSMSNLESGFADGTWRRFVQPIDSGLALLPVLHASRDEENALRHGQAAGLETNAGEARAQPADGLEARAQSADGLLIGIVRFDQETGLWRPRKIFAGA